MRTPLQTNKHSRRQFLTSSARLAAGLVLLSPYASLASHSRYQTLSFYHTHTGERLDLHFNLKTCLPESEKEIIHFLRDFRTGEIHSIDYQLLDTLCSLQRACGSSGTFEVISGYRSPATNKKLRNSSKGVAKKSLHMEGRAIDIRLTGVSTRELRAKACSLQRGGVGYYAKSDFIHLDTGRVRSW